MRRSDLLWAAMLSSFLIAGGCSRQAVSVENNLAASPAPAATSPAAPAASPDVRTGFQTAAKDAATPAQSALPADAPDPSRRFALLIGTSRYDSLIKRLQLRGPANDVDLMRKLLTERFQFLDDGEHLRMLSENAGPGNRPTRANIEREFTRLIERADPGSQVVVLMSGHGSRQPGTPDPGYPKPDGLDGIFLPADVGQWDGGKQSVANAIVDRELRAWTKAITAKGASLWFILDACCSSMTLRGGDESADSEERWRQVLPDDLKIPRDLQDQARARAASAAGTRGGAGESSFVLAPSSPNFVATYAAQYDQLTPEARMPPDRKSTAKPYGLFTYALCEVLSRNYAQPLTYLELVREIHAQYRRWGRTWGPTPLIEGLAQNTEVLGMRRWPGRSQITVERDGDGWKITAGRLVGIGEQSILAVYPAVTDPHPDKRLGYVRVTASDVLEAAIEPCRYLDPREPSAPQPAAQDLRAGQRCRVVRLEYGSLRLPVAVDEATCSSPLVLARLTALRQRLEELARAPEAMFAIVGLHEQPKWVIQERRGEIVLLSKDAAEVKNDPPGDVPRFPIPADPPVEKVKESLEQIARVTNLLSLTRPAVGGNAAVAVEEAAESSVCVEIQMVRLRDGSDMQGEKIELAGPEITLTPGQLVGWRLINRSPLTTDVTLLFIDSQFKIQAFFPGEGGGTENRLPRGANILACPATITDKTVGVEHIVLIAVRATAELPLDFSVLSQPTLALAETRGTTRGPGGPSVFDSRLGALLKTATFGAGATRGVPAADLSDFDLRLLSWRVQAKPKSPP